MDWIAGLVWGGIAAAIFSGAVSVNLWVAAREKNLKRATFMMERFHQVVGEMVQEDVPNPVREFLIALASEAYQPRITAHLLKTGRRGNRSDPDSDKFWEVAAAMGEQQSQRLSIAIGAALLASATTHPFRAEQLWCQLPLYFGGKSRQEPTPAVQERALRYVERHASRDAAGLQIFGRPAATA